MKNNRGFTLVEILVALFIFTILSMMLVGALRSVINTQSHTETSAEQLSQLQMTLLITSRDIEQAVDRPITNAQGHQEEAFTGSSHGFRLTHMGYANAAVTQKHSILQRTGYDWHANGFWRKTWSAVDQVPGTTAHERLLMPAVTEARFEYLDEAGHFQTDWPSRSQKAALPRAVKLTLTIANGGIVTQVVTIPAGNAKHAA